MKIEFEKSDRSLVPGPVPVKVVPTDLLKRLYLGITALIQYIEAAPNTLRWFADRQTLVESLPDFEYAREAAAKLKILLNPLPGNEQNLKAAGHFKLAKTLTGRELSWAIFANDDETVTLTVFERDKWASIELNEVSLGQMIELLKFHATRTDSRLRQ